MSRFLGIDLGTTFLKGAVLELDACALRDIRRVPFPEPVAGLGARRIEIEPGAVLAAVRQLLGELVERAPDAEGLVLSSQMHCLVLVGEDGAARSNVHSWKDQRALDPHPSGRGSIFEVLRERLSPDDVRRIGGELRVGVPLSVLFGWREAGLLEPYRGALVASLPDFVLGKLCGVEPTSEPMHACASGLYDLDAGAWHHELIDRLGLTGLRWPRLRRTGELVGHAEIAGKRLACFAPAGDQQTSLAGVALARGELSINISTGSQVSYLDGQRGELVGQIRPYFDGEWLHTIVQIPAGRALAVIADLLAEVARAQDAPSLDPWDAIERAVAATADSDLEVDLAFYAGAMGQRGAIGNIREDNLTVGKLFVAAFRAMARNYGMCARRLSSSLDGCRVVFSGGLAQRFERLRREILHELGGDLPHRLCASAEDTLLGLLAMALVSSGRARDMREAVERAASSAAG